MSTQPFTLDAKLSDALVAEFASQVDQLPKAMIEQFERLFAGDKSADFNMGLLAGYASAYSMASSPGFRLFRLEKIPLGGRSVGI